jgi:hypothetical protein
MRPTVALTGTFAMIPARPAAYLAVAVKGLEDGDETNPALLSQLRRVATPVTIGWGDSRELSLKVIDLANIH